MPELPEVETTCRGIEPHLRGRTITEVIVRHRGLRWRLPRGFEAGLAGSTIRGVERRGKYLIVELAGERRPAWLIVHLGMSGSLRITPAADAGQLRTHDHVDLVLDDGARLRFHDPRRFGSMHLTHRPPAQHWLLREIGAEPLSAAFTGDYLYEASRGRRVSVKNFLMNARIVAGVGNIYANEALFLAGIHPSRPAGRIARERYRRLAEAVKRVLAFSIEQGGTTLRDFVNEAGNPGYFRQQLNVYEKEGRPCPGCGTPIRQRLIGQRSSYFCPRCQT